MDPTGLVIDANLALPVGTQSAIADAAVTAKANAAMRSDFIFFIDLSGVVISVFIIRPLVWQRLHYLQRKTLHRVTIFFTGKAGT